MPDEVQEVQEEAASEQASDSPVEDAPQGPEEVVEEAPSEPEVVEAEVEIIVDTSVEEIEEPAIEEPAAEVESEEDGEELDSDEASKRPATPPSRQASAQAHMVAGAAALEARKRKGLKNRLG